MVALKPIKRGEEIFNDYGQLPRSDLLRRYGYITENYKKWDVVEIEPSFIFHTLSENRMLDKQSKKQRVNEQFTNSKSKG